jgi:putative polyhydroxyalkanoate system protein
MSDIKLVRPHSLPLTKAKALAQKTADALAAEYDLESEWHGNILRFHRSGVDGQMHVTDSEIRLDVKLGLLLKVFKGKITGHIERNFDELLAGSKKPAKKTASRK